MAAVSRTFTVDRPPHDVWEFLTTPDRVAPCVPGCESVEEVEPDVFDAEIAVEVAYTALTFDARVTVTEQVPGESLTAEVSAEPRGRMPGSATATGTASLEAVEGGTEGELTIEFAIRGRLGTLGESAFRHQCSELTGVFIDNVVTELGSPLEGVDHA